MGNDSITTKTTVDLATFLAKAKAMTTATTTHGHRGRLIFALDATSSRQATWDMAVGLQADMFRAAGGLDVQLVYYRGTGECQASRWAGDAATLIKAMEEIDCRAGFTQIGKVLAHALKETRTTPVQAMVFVGDAMEEKLGSLCDAAAELGRLKVPVFMFEERDDEVQPSVAETVEQAFREIARLSGGAYCRFDAGSAAQLATLLRSVATYAAGGLQALEASAGRGEYGAVKLLGQLRPTTAST